MLSFSTSGVFLHVVKASDVLEVRPVA